MASSRLSIELLSGLTCLAAGFALGSWFEHGGVVRAGRMGDALSCYRRAHDIDPEDGEWTDELEHPERASEE